MTVDFARKPAYEIARRLELRGKDSYSWFALIKPSILDALDECADEIEAFLGRKPRIVDATGLLVDDICAQLQNPLDDPVILTGFDDRTPEFWAALDVNRSGLERSGSVLFWISSPGLSSLCEHAPNLRSFIGGSMFILGTRGGEMTAQEKSERLKDLSSYYALSDEEIIHKAERRELPPEPEFVEWLVLLGRGDLV